MYNTQTINPLTSSYDFRRHSAEQMSAYFGRNMIQVDPDIAIADQIKDTPLDFNLTLQPVYRRVGMADGIEAYDSRRFLVNAANNEIFDIVGKNWSPHQPTEVLSTFQEWCDKQPELTLTHVGQLDGGRIIYALADYPEVMQFGEDTTIAKVLLSNFNKLGFSTKVDLFTYRIVCANGMTVRSSENSIRLNHTTKSADISDRLSNSLNQLHRNFSSYKQTMEQLTEISMSRVEAQLMLIKNFGDVNKELDDQPQIVQTALQLFEGRGKGSEYLSAYNTAYGLLQSCTEYLNHHSRKTSTHLSSVLYGSKNNSAQKMIQSLSNTYL